MQKFEKNIYNLDFSPNFPIYAIISVSWHETKRGGFMQLKINKFLSIG